MRVCSGKEALQDLLDNGKAESSSWDSLCKALAGSPEAREQEKAGTILKDQEAFLGRRKSQQTTEETQAWPVRCRPEQEAGEMQSMSEAVSTGEGAPDHTPSQGVTAKDRIPTGPPFSTPSEPPPRSAPLPMEELLCLPILDSWGQGTPASMNCT